MTSGADACGSGAQASYGEALLAGLAGLHASVLAQACSPQLRPPALPHSAGVEGLQRLAAPVQAVPHLAGSAAAAAPEAPPTQVNSTEGVLIWQYFMLNGRTG